MNTAKTRRARRRSGVGTGTTSLLMIFTVLCFATLAMLSLSTAASNDRIQERGLAGARALAEARGAAAAEVAALDETLLRLQSGPDYLENALAAAEALGWQADRAAGTVALRSPVDDDSVLVTTLQIMGPGDEFRYQVTGQVSELVNGWQPEEGGLLWQPSA